MLDRPVWKNLVNYLQNIFQMESIDFINLIFEQMTKCHEFLLCCSKYKCNFGEGLKS